MTVFNKESVSFICRAKENRKYVELESLLIKDSKVQLYTGIPINNKKGKIHYKEKPVEVPFRLVIAESKAEAGK
jgi:hypothetical protein